MVLQELHVHVAIRQQAHVVQQFARRDSPGAFLLHPGRAGAADAQLQVCSGHKSTGASPRPHHPLRQTQLTYQIALVDGEFHADCSYTSTAISRCIVTTAFPGPVQTVEDYLNYTKLNYFPPYLRDHCEPRKTLPAEACHTIYTVFPMRQKTATVQNRVNSL